MTVMNHLAVASTQFIALDAWVIWPPVLSIDWNSTLLKATLTFIKTLFTHGLWSPNCSFIIYPSISHIKNGSSFTITYHRIIVYNKYQQLKWAHDDENKTKCDITWQMAVLTLCIALNFFYSTTKLQKKWYTQREASE